MLVRGGGGGMQAKHKGFRGAGFEQLRQLRVKGL